MKDCSFNYVRTHRERHALTVDELGHLTGHASSGITKIESGDRMPTLAVALGLQVIFGLAPREMFPDFFGCIEEAVMRRTAALYDEIEDRSDRRSAAKCALFDSMPGRSGTDDIDL